MSKRNTKLPKVFSEIQEVDNKYIAESTTNFIRSMLFELADNYNRERIVQKKQEFLNWIKDKWLHKLLEDVTEQHTDLQWIAIKDIINILSSLDNLINEIDSHDIEMEFQIQRSNEVLCRNMSEFSESWEQRYNDMFAIKS